MLKKMLSNLGQYDHDYTQVEIPQSAELRNVSVLDRTTFLADSIGMFTCQYINHITLTVYTVTPELILLHPLEAG